LNPQRASRSRAAGQRLFEGVPRSALERTLATCPTSEIEPGAAILRAGDVNHTVFLILAGSVRVNLARQASGTDFVMGPGECFGELSIIDGGRVSAEVDAVERTTLCAVPEKVFWESIAPLPGVARNLLAILSERMRRANEAVIDGMRKGHLIERYQAELALARDIQASMLPGRFPMFAEHPEFACVPAMRSAREVGGDFYDAFLLDDRRLFVCVGDACGKGVPAALLMAKTLALVRAEAMRRKDLGKVLQRVNEALCRNNAASLFVSVFCAILDFHAGEFAFANGGHLPPFGAMADGAFEALALPKGVVLGAWPQLTYAVRRFHVRPRSTLIAYTDGIIEAENAAGEAYGEVRLNRLLDARRDLECDQLVASIYEDLCVFTGGTGLQDDATVLALRYFG